MTRKQKIEYLNEKVYPLFDSNRTCFMKPFEIIKAVERFRVGKPKDIQMIAENVNGCLFINGEFVIRIEYIRKPFVHSEALEYYEGRCLNNLQ